MTALLDAHQLFYTKALGRTAYLSPEVYFLIKQCCPQPPMDADAALLYELLAAVAMEHPELKRLCTMDMPRYNRAFTFLLKARYVTALSNGTWLNPNWSSFVYGSAEAWEKFVAPPVPATDPRAALSAILARSLDDKSVATFLRRA